MFTAPEMASIAPGGETQPDRGAVAKLSRLAQSQTFRHFPLEEALFAKAGAGRVIANSRGEGRSRPHLRISADKIDVVYNGLPLDSMRRDRWIGRKRGKQCGLSHDDVAVLFAGSGWERKGLRFAIDAVERQSAPDETPRRRTRRVTKISSSRVQFLGVVRGNAFALPRRRHLSLRRFTIHSRTPASEALAAGRPVITTRANGFSEIMENWPARHDRGRCARHRCARPPPSSSGRPARRGPGSAISRSPRSSYFEKRFRNVSDPDQIGTPFRGVRLLGR